MKFIFFVFVYIVLAWLLSVTESKLLIVAMALCVIPLMIYYTKWANKVLENHETVAFERGRQARLDIEPCPYPNDSFERAEWEAGWVAMDEQLELLS